MREMLRGLLAVALLSAGAAGCNAIGVAAYAASGGAKVPPEYKLQNRATLVLVENYENPEVFTVPAERLGRNITGELTDSKVATFIDPEKASDLKSADPTDFRKMDIPAVGRAVGARQVIYVNLVKFTTDSPLGGDRFVGKAEARVKVVDANTGQTIWPLDSSGGRDIKYETKVTQGIDDTNLTIVQDQLCQTFGEKIAKLFHETPLADQSIDEAAK